MEFSGEYLTYEEYKALGGTLDLLPFNLLEFEARRKIDINTFDRLKNCDEIPQEVKLCEYKLINSIEEYAKTTNSGGNIASESIDGYSVSYISADRISGVVKSRNKELTDIIRTYLLNVVCNGEHLLYCGVK